MISEANCHMKANLTQATGTPGVSETSGTVQTLRIETGPFKETDRGESIPVIFYVEWTLPENTGSSWQFQSCTDCVHQALCAKQSSREQGFPKRVLWNRILHMIVNGWGGSWEF